MRYFLQWARRRGLAGDLTVSLPPRQGPARLLAESDHIQRLDRCLTDETMPLDLRVGGALVFLFGMLVSRITQLTKNAAIEDDQATDGTAWCCRRGWRTSSADYVTRMSRDGRSAAWEPRCRGSSLGRAQRARSWTSFSASASTATALMPTTDATPGALPWPRCWLT